MALGGGALGATGFFTTGAFDSVAGSRPFDVATSEDDSALLGVDIKDPAGQSGQTVTLLELTNRFDEPFESIDAEVVSAGGGVTLRNVGTPGYLSPGSSAPITAELSCSTDTQGTVDVAITVSGPDQSVDLTRSVEVSCASPDRDVCASRTPPGCTVEEFPNGKTDCSVVVGTVDDVPRRIGGGTRIGGAVDVTVSDELTTALSGSVGEYLAIDGTDSIEFSTSGGSTVGGVVQLSSSGSVTATLKGSVGEGVCVDESGELDVNVGGGGAVDGPLSLASNDEVDVDLTGRATVGDVSVESTDGVGLTVADGSAIDGDLVIDASGGVGLTLNGDGRVRGDVTITSDSEVTVSLSGSAAIEGDLTVESTDEVDVSLSGSATIDGSVTVSADDEPGVVLKESASIAGDVTFESGEEPSVSDCSAVGGSVSPAAACDDGDDDDDD